MMILRQTCVCDVNVIDFVNNPSRGFHTQETFVSWLLAFLFLGKSTQTTVDFAMEVE